MNYKKTSPWHLWILTVIALLFFSIGAYDFINITIKNTSYLSKMYSSLGVEYFLTYPLPLLILFGINIICGISGILLALFNLKVAKKLILISAFSNTILILITTLFMNRIQIIGLQMTLTDTLVTFGTFGLYLYYDWISKKYI